MLRAAAAAAARAAPVRSPGGSALPFLPFRPLSPETQAARCASASANGWAAAEEVNPVTGKGLPLHRLAMVAAAPFAATLDALSAPPPPLSATPRRAAGTAAAAAAAAQPSPTAGGGCDVFVPRLPAFLCLSRAAAASPLLRSILVVDPAQALPKPRLSWYNPYDTTWIPSGWLEDGLLADWAYYMAPALNQASAAAASKAANQSAPRPFAPPSSAAQQRQQQPHEAELLHDLSWVEAEALDAYAAAWAARARAGGAEALLL